MSNPFDQFDAPTSSGAVANPFDQFDGPTLFRGNKEAISQRRDEMAARYASGDGPKVGVGKTPFHQAIGSQMKHAAEKMIYGGVFPMVNSNGKVGGSLNPFSAPSDEAAYPHQQTIDEGAAHVNKLKEEGVPNIGGGLVEAIPQVAAAVGTGGASFLPRAIAQGLTAAAFTHGDGAKRARAGAYAAAGDMVGTGVVSAAARAFRPINPTAQAQKLIDKGIYPTWGGSAGPAYKSIEDKLMSIPGIGDFTAAGRRGAINEYNAYTMSQSGVPIKPNQVGSEGHEIIGEHFRNKYPEVTKDLILDPNDPALKQTMDDIVRKNRLSTSGLRKYNAEINAMRADHNLPSWNINGGGAQAPSTQVSTNVGPSAPQRMDGGGIQDLTNELRLSSKEFQGPNSSMTERRTGKAFSDTRNSVFDAVERQNLGGDIQPLLDLNRDYNKYQVSVRASDAEGAANRGGIFTPAQGLKAFRQQARANNQSTALREGRVEGQDVHRAAFDVLGNNYPDSGTAGRLAVTSLVLGGGAIAAPGSALTVPMLTGAALANTKFGRKYGVGAQYDWQNPVADALRRAAPWAGGIGGATGAAIQDDQYKPWEQR